MEQSGENQKYLDILKKSKELFWKFGIKRVSVEEICEEANVSKMTFYKFFANKIDLARVVLDKVMEDALNQYTRLLGEDIPYREKIRKMILLKEEGTENISQEFVKDIYKDRQSELFDYFNKKTASIYSIIINDLRNAQHNGWIRKDIKPEFLLYMFDKMIEMSSDEKLLSYYKNEQELVLEVTNFFFYGILIQK
jgi:AcrR family transcriptional regulator